MTEDSDKSDFYQSRAITAEKNSEHDQATRRYITGLMRALHRNHPILA